jgi:hypothetical protein
MSTEHKKHAAANPPSPEERQPLKPGDEAPPGTEGAGEDICRRCHGTGEIDGKPCPDCDGSGRVTDGIGGA